MKTTRKSIILTLCCAVLLFASCGSKDAFVLEGTLQFGAGKTIYLEELTPDGPLFIDSIKLDKNGSFRYSYEMPYESFYNVHTTPTDYVMLLPQKQEHIVLDGDYRNLSWTYTVKGSPESTMLWQLQMYTNEGLDSLQQLVNKLDRLDHQLASNEITQKQYDDQKVIYDSIYLSYYSMQQNYVVDMINNNPGTLPTLIALYKEFNRHPLIDPAVNLDYYEQVLTALEEYMPENPHTINFHNTVERLKFKYQQ